MLEANWYYQEDKNNYRKAKHISLLNLLVDFAQRGDPNEFTALLEAKKLENDGWRVDICTHYIDAN